MKRLLFGLAFIAIVTALPRWQSQSRKARRSLSPQPERPSCDDIALRAYFIGLDHDAHGDPPDPLRDWVEAEHELLA